MLMVYHGAIPKRSKKVDEDRARNLDIMRMLLEDKTPPQIASALSLNSDELDRALSQIFEDYAKELSGRPIEHIYASVAISLTADIRKLHKIADAKDTHARDAVAAIKASADLRLRLLKEGRDMGVIVGAGPNDTGGGINMQFVLGLSNPGIRASMLKMAEHIIAIDEKLLDTKALGAADLFSGPSAFNVDTQQPE